MKRGQYEKIGNPLALTLDPKLPLEVYEARNAVDIAKSRGAVRVRPGNLFQGGGQLEDDGEFPGSQGR